MAFVNLHNHTCYSVTRALPTPKELLEKIKELGQSAVAICDNGTLMASWQAYKVYKASGVKLIIGCQFYIVEDLFSEERLKTIILIAKNHRGYKNLLELNYLANENLLIGNRHNYPRIDWNILQKYSSDLICLTSGADGILGQLICTRQIDLAKEKCKKLIDIFGSNLGLEIQANNLVRQAGPYNDYMDQRLVNNQLIKFAKEFNIKLIPTSNSLFLNSSDYEIHDALLCIGAAQIIKSNNRPKYTKDFYCKTEEEIRAFFNRLHPDQIDEWILNTEIFANMCENPDWIDPKFTNPSGKELPEFPVKDQKDYDQFCEWRNKQQKNIIEDKKEDSLYLKYLCDQNFNKKITGDKIKEIKKYNERLEEELDVLDTCGLSSYMLIVADYVNWAKNNNLPVGPGRGCVFGDTQVLTEFGYKEISDIKIGERVYSHLGNLQTVINKYEFDIDESGLEIKSNFSYNNLKMTKDHMIYAISKNEEIPQWIKASNLKVNDYIFNSLPNRFIQNVENFDLANFIDGIKKINIKNDYIELYNHNKYSPVSMASIIKQLRISQITVERFKRNSKQINKINQEKIIKILNENNVSLEDWRNDKHLIYNITRFIDPNKDFFYHLGRWIGDGSFHGKDGLNIAYHIDDKFGIDKAVKYFTALGYRVGISVRKKLNCTCVIIYSKLIYNLFKYLIPKYISSQTKHFPDFFRHLSDENLKNLLFGLFDSDGHTNFKKNNEETIITSSLELALQVKESFHYLNIPSNIISVKPNGKGKNNIYYIKFRGLKNEKYSKYKLNNGFISKIRSISSSNLTKVYDITVDQDFSYLTTNGVIHNSVGGSLVAHLIDIHLADPIVHDLIFARFHNKMKKSYSDIDCDFGQSAKPLVEKYIEEKYGKDKVAGISNYLHLSAKPYVKAIARIFQFGGDHKSAVEIGQNLSDLISGDDLDKKHIDEGLKESAILAEYAKTKYPELTIYSKLCGRVSGLATHAAGTVIGKRALKEITSLRKDKDGIWLLELDKDTCEEAGLVKMDILGLSTLDIIRDTHKILKERGKEIPKIDYYTFDQKTYDLISSGKCMCVFQFGTSEGTMELCRQIKPKTLEDLAIITTLARPSAKAIRIPFIKVRGGKAKIKYLHPKLERAFCKTYGFGLYEESLLILVQDIAGWNLHQADALRKMVKDKGKNPQKAQEIKESFIVDSVKHGMSEDMATKIWDGVIKNFGDYAFNKSHAILYSMISYETAYLKAHYPTEFLTANLIFEANSNSQKSDENIVKIKKELKDLGIKILPPKISESEKTFKIIDDHTILSGMDSMKYMGKDAIPEIIAHRPYSSFEDFLSKVDGKKVRSPAVSALAAAGALDNFKLSRKQMFLYASDFKKKVALWQKRANPGQFQYPWPDKIGEWSIPERYALEKYYLGEGLTGTFFQIYPGFFSNNCFNFKKLSDYYTPDLDKHERYFDSALGQLQGVIMEMREFLVKKEDSKIKGQQMAHLMIQDPFGNILKGTLFPGDLKEIKEYMKNMYGTKVKLEPGTAISFSGTIDWYQGDISILIDEIRKCAPPPAKPADLKPKKIAMRIGKNKSKIATEPEEILEEMEDEMDQLGLFEDEVME